MGAAANKPDFGTRVIGALKDVRDAIKSGEPLEKKFTVRTVILDLEPGEYDADSVREVRKLLGVSQALFAQILGVQPCTVESWEQDINEPCPMARRLLDEISEDSERWRKKLRKARHVVEQ